MADLENLLLEAAGRTGSGGRSRHSLPPSRKRRLQGSYSDDGSDSKDEDSDDDRGYTSRKPSGSQVPLKKRLDSNERDDDQASQEEADDDEDDDDDDDGSDRGSGSGDDSDVGSDLYKGEDDRQKLAQLTELERELILSERANKKVDKTLHEQVRSKRGAEKKTQPRKQTPPLTSSRAVRSSARSADRAAAKDDALNELRAKRLKQQDPEARRTRSRGHSPVKRKPVAPLSPSSSSQSESGSGSHSEDEGSTGDGPLRDSDEDKPASDSKVPTFDEIKDITIRRSKLAKWLMEPFFEELIVGCFVRVGIGMSKAGQSIYRLSIVRNVDATNPDSQYTLENKTTCKYLNCVWGSETSAARWQMARVSNTPPTQKEYDEWVREVERSGGRMPSRQDVLDKKEAIKKALNFVYSAATVKQMLQEKKSASTRPMNVAAEKEKLRREMDVAVSRQEVAEVERIKARLKQLDASRQSQKHDAKAIRLAEMNRKNKAENFKNASDLKPAIAGLKAGEAGYDPFSRRWTRTTNYYVPKGNVGGDKASVVENGDGGGGGTGGGSGGGDVGVQVVSEEGNVAGVNATVAALEAAADAGKLVDTRAPVDHGTESNTLHDFELPISLAGLQKFGGAQGVVAGYLARKQRIEATVGCRVPENDGRRHVLTLSVSDYKRRRGLL